MSTTISVDLTLADADKGGGSAWLMYQLNRALWRGEKFSKTHPEAKAYRHTLTEEAESLGLVLISLKERKISDDALDPSFRDLVRVGRDNLIEPFVLLNDADEEIARDYEAYRETHRAELRRYLEKYIIHKNAENKP